MLAVLFALLLWLPAALCADVQLQLDRTRVTEGETVTLTFRTDDEKQQLDPDLGVLEGDFEILGSRSETQVSIVNGRQTAVVRLLVTVEPRRSGRLTIPPIDVGGSRTQPVVLQVDPAPEPAPGELPPVFLEVEITPQEGPYYVHAQLGLVVRVFYLTNLSEAAISPPEPTPASVRLLQETPYKADRGGERYNVLERRYAVFPERSGDLVLPSMQLSGRLVERRNSAWQPAMRGRRVTVESDPVTLQIEPRPASFTGDQWQPARDYSISQQISGTDGLRVGEPVTRTVIIDAVGLEENMIVEPQWPELPDTRIYPDQPHGISRDDGEWVLGHKEFRYAVVPEKEGEMVLPELTVHWWDVEDDRQRTATLPAQTVYVQPAALVPPPAPADLPAAGAPAQPPASALDGAAAWWRWLALFFAALWLLTLAAAVRMRRTRARGAPGSGVRPGEMAGEADVMGALREACKRDDSPGARRALQAWLRDFGPTATPSLLEFAAAHAGSELADRLYALDARGYRPGGADGWDGKATLAAFEAWRRNWRNTEAAEQPSPTDLYAPANRQR